MIRPATPSDNNSLLELCRLAPMEGIVKAWVDQSPDFFRLPSLQGFDHKVWVAENNGIVDGCVIESYKTVNYNNKECRTFYIGDMKVRPEARGTLGLKLSSHVIAQAKQKGYALGECFIIDGNEKMIKVLEWLGTKIFTRALAGHAMIYQIPPVRNYRVDKSYSIRHACEKDIPRIAELLREQYRDYSSSPVFNRDEFIHMLRADTSFGIENFRIAEKDGQIVACAAFWDQQTIRRTVVEEFSRKGALAVSVLRFMNPLLKLPSLPSRGDVLKYIYLRFPAHEPDHSAALRAIIRQESNHLRKLRLYHFIWAGFHQADPLASCINGMVKLNMKVNIFHLKFSDEVELISETLSDSKPVYVDFSLI